MEPTKRLDELRPGEQAEVLQLTCTGALRRRLIDMGITPGVQLTLRRAAPMGDPLELFLRGYTLSLRRSEAREIAVRPREGGGL